MANRSRVFAHSVGTHLFPFLSIDNVLYVRVSPFNLLSISCLIRSLHCVISFTQTSVCLENRSSRQMIGTKCESYGLYHLRTSSHVGAIIKSPTLLLHAQLGHLNLAKLHQVVFGLSKLSKLVFESCQLGKHSRSSFPCSVAHGASFPFSLVYSDIWGPSRVTSSLGFQYYYFY